MSEATITISPIEVLVLKKLTLVNMALAKTFGDTSHGREQLALTQVLNEITLRADLANLTAKADAS